MSFLLHHFVSRSELTQNWRARGFCKYRRVRFPWTYGTDDSMSYAKAPPVQHVQLLDKISRALSGEDVPRFKNRCLAEGIRPGEAERRSVLGLLQMLDQRRVIAPGRYDRLLQVLMDIDRADLVEQFFSQERPPENQPVSTPSQIPDPKETDNPCLHRGQHLAMNSVVTEKSLSWLASKMGAEWEQVGIGCMGFSQNEIFQCKADNPNSVHNQIFSMLNKWRCRSGYNSTYAQLFEVLCKYKDFDVTILVEMKERISKS